MHFRQTDSSCFVSFLLSTRFRNLVLSLGETLTSVLLPLPIMPAQFCLVGNEFMAK